MKKTITLLLALILTSNAIKSQAPTTAKDFNMNDCNGQMHNLFSELNGDNVVILEFFMLNCSSCINAAKAIHPMFNKISNNYPTRLKYYAFGFQNTQPSYSCTNISNWVTTNKFTNVVPFDSGAAQVAYYGGMGMPTIAVVGGTAHQVLYSSVGFSTSDTATIGTAIRNFLKNTAVGIEEKQNSVSDFQLLPNPANDNIQLNFELKTSETMTLQIVNLLGEQVKEISLGHLSAGQYKQAVAIDELQTGIYFMQLKTGNTQISKKFTVVH